MSIVVYRVSAPESGQGTKVGWIGTLTSKDPHGNIIETWNAESTADDLSVGNQRDPGYTSDRVWNAYPNTAGASSGDLRM